jgi:hypothetical protein
MIFVTKRDLYDRPVKEMSDGDLIQIESRWRRGQAFQDHGEIYYVRRAYFKPGGDKAKIVFAYKRILEIQEEILRRRQPGEDVSWINRNIHLTRELLSILDPPDKVSGAVSPAFESTLAALKKRMADAEYKPPPKAKRKKSTKTLFLESFESYLLQIDSSEGVIIFLKDLIRHPKEIGALTDKRKKYLTEKIEGHKECLGQEELAMFGDIISKLLKQAETADKGA